MASFLGLGERENHLVLLCCWVICVGLCRRGPWKDARVHEGGHGEVKPHVHQKDGEDGSDEPHVLLHPEVVDAGPGQEGAAQDEEDDPGHESQAGVTGATGAHGDG